MDRILLAAICEKQQKRELAALVTIVSTRGSTPRKPGAGMLIARDGQTTGTIGGGCGEAEVKRQALTALDENCSRLFTVTLLNETAAEEGMACGGVMEVFIQMIGRE